MTRPDLVDCRAVLVPVKGKALARRCCALPLTEAARRSSGFGQGGETSFSAKPWNGFIKQISRFDCKLLPRIEELAPAIVFFVGFALACAGCIQCAAAQSVLHPQSVPLVGPEQLLTLCHNETSACDGYIEGVIDADFLFGAFGLANGSKHNASDACVPPTTAQERRQIVVTYLQNHFDPSQGVAGANAVRLAIEQAFPCPP